MYPLLAIGGSASVGKTTLAAALANELGRAAVAHVDDLVPDLEADEGPSFITATPGVWRRSADWLRDQLVDWTARLHPRVDHVMAELLDHGGGIIEGEGIDPRLVRSWNVDVVKSVYVIETDPDVLHRTFTGRSSDYRALSAAERHGVVEMNRRYGLWLRSIADAHGQPWVPSQPWSTLCERTLASII